MPEKLTNPQAPFMVTPAQRNIVLGNVLAAPLLGSNISDVAGGTLGGLLLHNMSQSKAYGPLVKQFVGQHPVAPGIVGSVVGALVARAMNSNTRERERRRRY